MELPEEQNKLKEIAAGNVEAFEHLFFQYQPRLVNFLIGLTHDKEVSRDMAQDLFLSLWKDREKLKNVRSFSSYLFQMARFTVYDYFDRLIVSEKYTNEYLQDDGNVMLASVPEKLTGMKVPRAAIDHQPYGRAHVSPAKQNIPDEP